MNDTTLLVLGVLLLAMASKPPPAPAADDGMPSPGDYIPDADDVIGLLGSIFGGGSNDEAQA